MPKHVWPTVAGLFTNVLIERDSSISLIRLIDRMGVVRPDPEMLKKGDPVVDTTLFVALRGDQPGDYELTVSIETPSGKKGEHKSKVLPIRIEGAHSGYNVNSRLLVKLDGEGMYWIHVLLDGEAVARIPLQIQYTDDDRLVGSETAPPPPSTNLPIQE